jgi:hypothetical protein
MPRASVWILAFSFGFISMTTGGQTRRLMDDPLFAIRYDTAKVHFESMPISLVKRCPDLRNRYTDAWIYGHTETMDAEYFIVSGLVKYFDEETGKETGVYPDIDGLIIAIHGPTCSVEAEDSFYWMKNSPVWNLPEAALAADALQRYAKAFGGKRTFLKNVPTKDRENLAPEMRKQLEIFEKQSGDP